MFSIHQGAWRKIGIILLVVILLAGITFKLFPETLSASSVITVITGILASIAVIIQLHEHFNKAKQNV